MTAPESVQGSSQLLCSVVVTTWSRPILLQETLASIFRQTYPRTEIIVVSDGNDEDVRSIAQGSPESQNLRWIFHPENRGLPAARNSGVREANGDIVLFLDDDVIAAPDLVAIHMRHHQLASPFRKVAVVSLTSEERKTPLNSFVNQALDKAWRQQLEDLGRTLRATGEASVGIDIEKCIWFGLNSSIRRDLYLSLGGFNEHFRASDEEMEAGLRFYLAGVEFLYEPSALLTHCNSKDLDTYKLKCWRASGVLDRYRLFELGQRNAHTQQLVSMLRGYLLDRLYLRATWQFSGPLKSLSRQLHDAANRQQSPVLFGIWSRIARQAEYWSGVKESGCTLHQLQTVAGSPKTALMLHSIAVPESREEASYYISPRRFHRLMNCLHLAGYKAATLSEWLHDEVPEKHVLITFDDAYDDLYCELLPLVIERQYKPVIYVVADRIGASNIWDQASGLCARNLLTLDQIREMQKYGVEFGSHSLTHPRLTEVTDAQLQCEVRDSKLKLEDLLGVEITSFAYPFGGVDRRVHSAVAAAGYKLAFTTIPGSNWWNDPLCQKRADVNNSTSVIDFAIQLRTGYDFIQSISTRLRHLEQELPTHALRTVIRSIRTAGHKSRQLISSRVPKEESE